MVLKFFNSFGNSLEEFKPIKTGCVGLYTCGPTVYNFMHIGNLRSFSFEDIVKRYLLFKGLNVKHVMNLTDVEDKIIKHANIAHVSIYDFTAPYKKAFFEDLKTINIMPADVYPEATQCIPEMVKLIQTLIEKGLAYCGEDNCIYFSIKKFKNYGKLAGIDIKKLKAGARIKQDEYEKEGVGDFALWKAWDENDGATYWDTPLGKGRPGWHIECSAMSKKHLGESFDIHMGGVDNKFPHHENEIAQSEGASGEKFVNYWLHCEHLLVDGKKMSKSLGNYFTLRDLLKMNLNPLAIRYVLINSNYRQQINFTIDAVKDAEKTLLGLQNFISRVRAIIESKKNMELDKSSAKNIKSSAKAPDLVKQFSKNALADFEGVMDNDFNVPSALKFVFEFVKKVNKLIDDDALDASSASEAFEFMKKIDSVLGVFDFTEKFFELSAEQEKLVKEREVARKNKDWKKSDELRDELKKEGIEVIDNKDGTTSAKSVQK